jgi:predicted amidohydrolase
MPSIVDESVALTTLKYVNNLLPDIVVSSVTCHQIIHIDGVQLTNAMSSVFSLHQYLHTASNNSTESPACINIYNSIK